MPRMLQPPEAHRADDRVSSGREPFLPAFFGRLCRPSLSSPSRSFPNGEFRLKRRATDWVLFMHGEACSGVTSKKRGAERRESNSGIVTMSQRLYADARREWFEELVLGQSKPGPDDPHLRPVADETGTSGQGAISDRGPTTGPLGRRLASTLSIPAAQLSSFGVSVARTGLDGWSCAPALFGWGWRTAWVRS